MNPGKRDDVMAHLDTQIGRANVRFNQRDGLNDEIHKLQRRIAKAHKYPLSLSEGHKAERLSAILESRMQALAELDAPPTPAKQVTSLPLPEYDVLGDPPVQIEKGQVDGHA